MGDVKQVIVIDRSLKMRQGKAIAQGAHAAMMFMIEAGSTGRELSEVESQWFQEGITKIVLQVPDGAALQSVVARAREAGLAVHTVTDAGHTEFHGVPTLTCCAIGPDCAERIDLITSDLKLL